MGYPLILASPGKLFILKSFVYENLQNWRPDNLNCFFGVL